MQRYRGTCSGNCPLAVSPLSMTQSAPSRMALATSDDSARVGRGFLIMLSSICVAQTIGLPARLHRPIIIFCARKIFSVGISMPRSPRATITPSVDSRISSNRLTPSWFSIFEMILILRPLSPRTCCARARYCYPAIRGSSHIVVCIFTLSSAQRRIARRHLRVLDSRLPVSSLSTSSCRVVRLVAGRSCRRYYC